MSGSFNSPRLGLGLSEERRVALQTANKLKQELYAQQKKIQFSNLLERSNEDVNAYIESQNNVFISPRNTKAPEEPNDKTSYTTSLEGEPIYETSRNENYSIENDDLDGFDFFYGRSFYPPNQIKYPLFNSQNDLIFDPAESRPQSLRDHLLEQLHLDGKYDSLSPETKILCEKIIDNLDSSGYFKADAKPKVTPNAIAYPDYGENIEQVIDELDVMFGKQSTHEERLRMKKALDDYFAPNALSKFSRRLAREEFDSIIGRKTTKKEREYAKKILDQLEFTLEDSDPTMALFPHKPSQEERNLAENALSIVQTLDPPGVGARDLRESLLLRLRPNTPHARELRTIISDYFDDFCKKRIGVLSEKTGISSTILSEIYSLPFPFFPSPEQLYSTNNIPTRWIQPEIIVYQAPNGRWKVRLDDSQHNVELNPEYRKMLISKQIDKKTREYLRKQLVEAQALLDALRNRNSTLLRVAQAIIDFQYEVFSDTTATPKPLTQQQIADKLGLDSSTVSRACNDKWISTPRGFVAFKTFFPKAVSGDATSANIAEVIRLIVDQENKLKPLSDEEIAAILTSQYNIKVSRKTVQEHRDHLQIPNSRARKRMEGSKESPV